MLNLLLPINNLKNYELKFTNSDDIQLIQEQYNINLQTIRQHTEEKQVLQIKYNNQLIIVNFKTRTLEFIDNDKLKYKIEVNNKQAYATQIQMVLDCIIRRINPEIIDNRRNQLDVLEFIFNYNTER